MAKDALYRKSSYRQLQVGEEVRRLLSEIFLRSDLRDPELVSTTLSITEVKMSPDLMHAFVFVYPLGGERLTQVVQALNNTASYLRGQIAKKIKLRRTPDLRFIADTSFDYAQRIQDVLNTQEKRQDAPLEDDGQY